MINGQAVNPPIQGCKVNERVQDEIVCRVLSDLHELSWVGGKGHSIGEGQERRESMQNTVRLYEWYSVALQCVNHYTRDFSSLYLIQNISTGSVW